VFYDVPAKYTVTDSVLLSSHQRKRWEIIPNIPNLFHCKSCLLIRIAKSFFIVQKAGHSDKKNMVIFIVVI
jgi:hypothetical protein